MTSMVNSQGSSSEKTSARRRASRFCQSRVLGCFVSLTRGEQVSGVEPFYPRHTECPWVGWLAVNEMEPEAFGLSYNERATHLFADTTTALYGDVLVTLRLVRCLLSSSGPPMRHA